jgi:hypothetical protein
VGQFESVPSEKLVRMNCPSTVRKHGARTKIINDDGTQTKRTPAMAAGVADYVWTLGDIAALLDSN